jgi:SAM-dependent methyltransferase
VLDVGCGCGETTRDAARLAYEGNALGVDLSGAMLARARQRSAVEGLANVAFVQADAQVHHLGDADRDVAVSRTGAMFFADPVAAFANIARALVPGGRLVLLNWQPFADNEWVAAINGALAAGRALPPPPPDAPGPFGLANPDRVRAVLTAAGYRDVELADVRAPMYFGPDAAAAHDFVAGLMGWMLDGLDEEGRRGALDALRATMEEHDTGVGVYFGSATWLVTARLA